MAKIDLSPSAADSRPSPERGATAPWSPASGRSSRPFATRLADCLRLVRRGLRRADVVWREL